MNITYKCERCGKPHTAAVDSLLARFQLCPGCQEKRYAAGLKAQRETEAK